MTEAFLGRRVDGILLTGVTHGNGFGTDLKHAGIPVVKTWDMSSRPIYMVAGFGNEKAGVAVAAYMLSMGHRKYSANAYIREGGREEGRGVRRTNVIGTVARNCQSE